MSEPAPIAPEVEELVQELLSRAPSDALPLIEEVIEWARREDRGKELAERGLEAAQEALREVRGEDLATVHRLATARLLLDAVRDAHLVPGAHDDPDPPAEVRRDLAWLSPLARAASVQEVQDLDELVEDLRFQELERALLDPRTFTEPARFLLRVVSERARWGMSEELGRVLHVEERFWRRLIRPEDTNGKLTRGMSGRLAEASGQIVEELIHADDGVDLAARLKGLDAGTAVLSRCFEYAREHSPPQDRKEIHRALCRLKRTRVDLLVRRGQIAQVGERGLKTIELLVLLMILAVLGILGLQSFGTVSPTTDMWLNVVDLFVCLFFLGEFTWRWRIARWRGSYFGRHFLIDVLPSLPFPLIDLLFHNHALHNVQALRSLRGMRILRTLRLMRPFVQVFRIIAFSVRGLDRLVQRNASLLNRDIVLFEDEGAVPVDRRDLEKDLLRARQRISRRMRITAAGMEAAPRTDLVVELLHAHTDRLEGYRPRWAASARETRHGHRILLPDLINAFLNVHPEDIEDRFGRAGAARLARMGRLLDLPLLRALPLLRRVIPPLRARDPVQGLTHSARALGRAIERLRGLAYWFADLSGVITGPQLLDRIGAALAKATKRPAMRLLMIGSAVLILTGIVELFPSAWLEGVLRKISKLLGLPLILLGLISFGLHLLGRWIRSIAGEASDFFQRVAEAQGINLVKLHKLTALRRDLGFLFDRVVEPELRAVRHTPAEIEAARAKFLTQQPGSFGRDQVLFLYQDWLDGAILHRSDVRTTQQFLGNLDLGALRRHQMGMSGKDEKKLRKLDLSRPSTLPTGPSFWFQFLAESLSEKCAKLVLAYNQRAVPLGHRHLVPPERVAAHERWLRGEEAPESLRESNRGLLNAHAGVSTFTSLHFLAADPARDAEVQEEFGPELLARLRRDRQAMIREVFGTQPFSRLPVEARSLNVYSLYFRWLGHGLVLLLPLRLAFLAVGGLFRLLWRVVRLVREQLHPERFPKDPRANWAGLAVALRKINRMRRPVFMAALDLRSRFDPEYLGQGLPDHRDPPDRMGDVFQDLDLVGAPMSTRIRYTERKLRREQRRSRLAGLLRGLDWPQVPLARALDPAGPDHPEESEDEVVRAVTAAYGVNYQGCRILLHGREELRDHLRDLLLAPPPVRPRKRVVSPGHRKLLRLALELLPDDVPEPVDLELLRGLLATDHQGLRTRLRVVARQDADRARADGLRILAGVARYPHPWTRQLVTLRTIQSLTCLDIQNTRSLVEELGDYDEGMDQEHSESAVVLERYDTTPPRGTSRGGPPGS